MTTSSGEDPVDGPEPDDPQAVGTEGGGSELVGGDPLRFNNWMKRSAAGAVMTGIARGFHQALEPRRAESALVIEAGDEPDDSDGPIELRFDPDDPSATVALIRRPADPRPDRGDAPPGP